MPSFLCILIQWQQARSTRTCEVSVTCKKSSSNMKLSKWTQFPALVTGLSRYYVNKNRKKYFLIHLIFINMHRVLTLSSWKESPLRDLLFAAVKSWVWSLQTWRIILLIQVLCLCLYSTTYCRTFQGSNHDTEPRKNMLKSLYGPQYNFIKPCNTKMLTMNALAIEVRIIRFLNADVRSCLMS